MTYIVTNHFGYLVIVIIALVVWFYRKYISARIKNWKAKRKQVGIEGIE